LGVDECGVLETQKVIKAEWKAYSKDNKIKDIGHMKLFVGRLMTASQAKNIDWIHTPKLIK
jgi:hypothetical protein